MALIQLQHFSVLVCDRDARPATWIEILEYADSLPVQPSVILASRLADEKLWLDALNLGAWDVLTKPFERAEVVRSVAAGYRHFQLRTSM